jgi:hypothetical protein
VRTVSWHFFDRDGTHPGRRVHIDQLFGRGIFAGNQHVAKQHRERLVAHQIARHQHRVAKAERLLLPCVADLHHVRDIADHAGLLLFAVFFQEILEKRRSVEVILDGAFAAAGDNNDVLDAGGHAFFRHVLNLRLIDNGEHFFGLRFGGRQKPRAQSGGRQNCFSDFTHGSGVRRRRRVVCSH